MFYKSLGFDSQIDLISFPASPCEPGAASAMPVVHKPLYNASYVLHFWRDRMDEPPYQGTAFGTRSFVNGFWHLAGVTRYFLNSHSAGRFKSGQCTENPPSEELHSMRSACQLPRYLIRKTTVLTQCAAR